MSRAARKKVLYNGCYAHVFSRSIDKRIIFERRNDFEVFRSILRKTKKIHDFQIYHYCFMNTHFHFAVGIPDVNEFSKAFQRIKWSYTIYFNKRHKRKGPLWSERFRSLLIENEAYMYACGVYIENNPVKAGLVKRIGEWPYCSRNYYYNKANDDLIDKYKLPRASEKIVIEDERIFTKGLGIGSDMFIQSKK